VGALEKLRTFLLCLTLGGHPTFADTRAFFSSGQSLENELVRQVEASRLSIDIALFDFRSPRLSQALVRARARGVLLRVLLDAGYGARHMSRSGGASLFRPGEVRFLGGKRARGHGVMHHKFAVFDQDLVITGSYNWTPGAEHVNYENLLRTDDAQSVGSYAREFDTLWRRGRLGQAFPVKKFPPKGRPKSARIWRPEAVQRRTSNSSN
jgi:mitochondrial cardiolipin hydrolase